MTEQQRTDREQLRIPPAAGQMEFLPAAHAMVLGMVATGASLSTILDSICRLIELDLPECRCSVLLASPEGRLFNAAAPSLPTPWLEALAEGVPIAADEASCGAAAWSLRPVMVADISTAASWRRYAPAAIAQGLWACWSVPILVEDELLGTVAVYYDRPRSPEPGDLQHLAGYAQLAAVAISRTRAEDRLRSHLAHDPLTGLPGRRQLSDAVGSAVARLRDWDHGRVGVVAVRLPRLREVNATFGHVAGDALLRAAAAALSEVSAGRGMLLRSGGNRFVVVADPLPDDASVLELAHDLLAAVQNRVAADLDPGVDLDAVAGLAVASRADYDPQRLAQEADLAADEAAATPDQSLVVFDEEVVTRAAADLALELGLRRAVRRNELTVHYQPIVDLRTGQVAAVEALVRWDDPEDGLRGPTEFIAVAERTGLVRSITRTVLDEACVQAAAWRQSRPEHPVSVSVNMSAAQLHDPTLVDDVRAALDRSGIAPAMLWLEITETAVMTDADASLATLRNLKSLGVRLAIDDFGTGYSSLAYLKNLPVDIIKVDGSFVREIPGSPQDAALVTAISSMADCLGLDVIAEGVETADQRDALAAIGLHLAQGFLWSRPAPADTPGLLSATVLGNVVQASRSTRPTQGVLEDELNVVVHELRAPLSVIRLTMDTAAVAPDRADLRRIAATVQRQVHVMDAVLQTLSTAHALERGSVGLKPEPVDLVALAAAVAADCRPLLTRARIEIDAPAPVALVADPARVHQILANLLTNADKHCPPGGVVTVAVDIHEGHGRVRVVDDGPGIEPVELSRVFRKFARADHAQPGIGLGLYIARGLARAHSGDLLAANHPSRGAVFTLLLPGAPRRAPGGSGGDTLG